jgi:hypothetical protein
MALQPAAALARTLIDRAALSLGAMSPVRVRKFGALVDDTLTDPPGSYPARNDPLTTDHSEAMGGAVSLSLRPLADHASPAEQAEAASHGMRDLVADFYGRDALHWLDGRTEGARRNGHRWVHWGAVLGTRFDRNGMAESSITYEWGPDLTDTFPEALYRLARVAMDALPGLRPAFSTIRCGRNAGSQQITFEVDAPLALSSLKPLMDSVGLGGEHASLMSACAFILGARFTLPPNSARITLRPIMTGVELRLDVELSAIPDLPPQLMSLLRLQMGERPRSLAALNLWLDAFTLEGYEHPGGLSVLSIWVRPNVPARIALHLRPAVIDEPPAGVPAGEPTPQETARAGGSPATVVTDSTPVTAGRWEA